MPATQWLSREERRALARRARQPAANGAAAGRCLFCLGPLTNGRPVCDDTCDDAYWRLVPTINGELFTPQEKPGRSRAKLDSWE